MVGAVRIPGRRVVREEYPDAGIVGRSASVAELECRDVAGGRAECENSVDAVPCQTEILLDPSEAEKTTWRYRGTIGDAGSHGRNLQTRSASMPALWEAPCPVRIVELTSPSVVFTRSEGDDGH